MSSLAAQQRRDRVRLAAETYVRPSRAASGDLSVCVVYPHTYPVGMANLGFQAIYGILADAGVAVERAFVPDEPGAPAGRSFESDRPLSSFDVLAFSISFETDYVHVLDVLAGAGLALRSARRSPRDPLVVAGGPAVFLNPEPLADFVDLFLIGEGEEMVPEWLSALRGVARQRDGLLDASATITGAYVPARFTRDPDTGIVCEGQTVLRRYVTRLDAFPTASRILAPDSVFGDKFLVEASRGCEWGCRFCAAGFMYRPVRHRSAASLERQVLDEAMSHRSSVGLIGAEMASQPGIATLCQKVADRGGRASPSSLKADLVSPALARALASGATESATLAPEAGSERMRRVINKNLTESEILRAAELLGGNGVTSLKLYAMIGLPTETDADVTAIAELAGRIRSRLPALGRITLSINPFVPKPWTPLQWEPMAERRELRDKHRLLLRAAREYSGATVDFESPRDAEWQTLLSRGDRRVGAYVEAVHRAGGAFWPVLQRARREGGLRDTSDSTRGATGSTPPPEWYVTRRLDADERLAWDFIDHRVDKRYLRREWQKALAERETAPCDVATCHTCAAC